MIINLTPFKANRKHIEAGVIDAPNMDDWHLPQGEMR